MAAGAAHDVKGEMILADHPNAFFMAIRQPEEIIEYERRISSGQTQ